MKHSERFTALVDDAKTRIEEIGPEETLALIQGDADVLVIDVREDNEWDRGRITGAIHIGRGVLERDIEQHVDRLDAPVVLYCGGGYRSALAADNLQQMGFTNVRSLAGGWRGWTEQNFPTET